MIETYIHKNIIQYLSRQIAFNDLIRCLDADSTDPTDITKRYKTSDLFFKHVEDQIISKAESSFLYPFISIEYRPKSLGVKFDCGDEIDIVFYVAVKPCTPEDCDDCQISITNTREHANKIRNYLINLFYMNIFDTDNTVKKGTLFDVLRCTEQLGFDCEDEEGEESIWKYNVFATLSRDPIQSPLIARSDGIVEFNLTVPLFVNSIEDNTYCENCIPED